MTTNDVPSTVPESLEGHAIVPATWLSATHPRQSHAPYAGVAIDQIAAQHIGQDTPLPSLEMAVSRIDRSCAYNYHCAYTHSMAWKSATEPLPAVREPRVVFEQLFGAGDSASDRASRRSTNKY